MRMAEVSVVIPVYHAEKYIRICLDSLLGQTLKEIEIICVLDCPQDKTGDILKEIAQNDRRIRVIENEKNIGAACSRNKGMRYTTTNYLIFLDADDVFEFDMLEILYRRMKETEADMCLFEFDAFYEGEKWQKTVNEQESQYPDVFSIAELPEEGLNRLPAATWNRIYRKSFLEENGLVFQNLRTDNDAYMGIMSLLLAGKITHTKTDKAYLHYRLGVCGQITARTNPFDTCMAYQRINVELKERGLWEQYKSCFWIKFLLSFSRQLSNGGNEEYNRKAYRWVQEAGGTELGLLDVKEEDFQCPYYAVEIRNFFAKDYENGWFRYAVRMQMQLEYHKEKIINLCKLWNQEGKKFAVWGAGQYGSTILHFFDEYRIHCDTVIDIDHRRQGSHIENRMIYAFEEVALLLDIIIVANKKYAGQVRAAVDGQGGKICVITVEEMAGRSDIT